MAWYNSSWLYRKKITIGAQSGSLTNFPVYVNLADLGTSFFDYVKSDGGDIRVTTSDGVTEVARELVAIDKTAKTGEFYFKASSLSSSVSTDFYIYYGNSSASNPSDSATYGRYNVWTEFRIVYHFTNWPDGISSGKTTTNSVQNSIHATIKNTPPNTTLYDSPIGKAFDLTSSTNCYLTASDTTDPTEYTISTYSYFKSAGVITVRNSGDNNASGSFSHVLRYKSNKAEHYYFDGATATITGNNTLSLNTWYHFAATAKDSGTGYLYVDGTQQTATDSTGTLWTGGDTWNLLGRDGSSSDWFTGYCDELRISYTQKPTAWILSERNNLSSPSTFYTIGSLESFKTFWIKVSGTWKQATPWIKVSGTWKQAIPWIKISGNWK